VELAASDLLEAPTVAALDDAQPGELPAEEIPNRTP
jgi:hypothetical protein